MMTKAYCRHRDWAGKKGQRYGTIIGDLEQHCPIALLEAPDVWQGQVRASATPGASGELSFTNSGHKPVPCEQIHWRAITRGRMAYGLHKRGEYGV